MFSFPRSWYPDLRNVISAKIPLNGFIGFIFWTGILLLAFNRSNSSSKAVTVGLALAYSGSSRISSHFGPSLKEISPLKMWRSPILIGQVSKSIVQSPVHLCPDLITHQNWLFSELQHCPICSSPSFYRRWLPEAVDFGDPSRHISIIC